MRIYVKVFARSAKNEVQEINQGEYTIRVTAPPVNGKANQAVIKELSKYLKVSKSRVEIVAGKSAKIKIVDINL